MTLHRIYWCVEIHSSERQYANNTKANQIKMSAGTRSAFYVAVRHNLWWVIEWNGQRWKPKHIRCQTETNTGAKRPTKVDPLTCAYLPKWYISRHATNETIKRIPMNATLTQSPWIPYFHASDEPSGAHVFVSRESKNRRPLRLCALQNCHNTCKRISIKSPNEKVIWLRYSRKWEKATISTKLLATFVWVLFIPLSLCIWISRPQRRSSRDPFGIEWIDVNALSWNFAQPRTLRVQFAL